MGISTARHPQSHYLGEERHHQVKAGGASGATHCKLQETVGAWGSEALTVGLQDGGIYYKGQCMGFEVCQEGGK